MMVAAQALPAQEVLTRAVPDTAIPYGKRRRLLAKQCPPEALRQSLLPLDKYHPYPTLGDPAWQALRAETRSALLAAGETSLKRTFEPVPATLFLEYKRNGNRSHYEAVRTGNLNALRNLTYAECLENKGRFLDAIANGLWTISEQSFWGVPAHLYIQKQGLGLPDPKDPIVDLFAAETAALLASVVYVLGPALDSVSPVVRQRIFAECERRIFNPLLTQNFMWMGLPNAKRRDDLPWDATPAGQVQPVNNWDAWICWNWLTTALLVDTDAERRTRSVEKAMVCLDNFIDTYPDDGGCEEGPSYFNRAAVSMYEALQLLSSATAGRVDIWHDPLLRRMGEYFVKARIAGDQYLDIGDAHVEVSFDRDSLFQYGKRVESPLMMDLARADLPQAYVPSTLPALFDEVTFRAAKPSVSPLLKDVWLPETFLFAARMQANDPRGLYLGCIAADNGKSHTHNDTGNIWIYLDGEPVLIDLGNRQYTFQSFNMHRFEQQSIQSAYHNLPTINGVQQGNGTAYRATEHKYKTNGNASELRFELAEAYPKQAGLRGFSRFLQLDRSSQRITVEDSYKQADAQPITWSFMTCRKPEVQGASILLPPRSRDRSKAVTMGFDSKLMTAKVETVLLDDPLQKASWGEAVYRILISVATPAAAGSARFTFTA